MTKSRRSVDLEDNCPQKDVENNKISNFIQYSDRVWYDLKPPPPILISFTFTGFQGWVWGFFICYLLQALDLGCEFRVPFRFPIKVNRRGTRNFTEFDRNYRYVTMWLWFRRCFLHCHIRGRFSVTSTIETCSNRFAVVEIGLNNTLGPFAGVCAVFGSYFGHILQNVPMHITPEFAKLHRTRFRLIWPES